jgi:hypothetical protein
LEKLFSILLTYFLVKIKNYFLFYVEQHARQYSVKKNNFHTGDFTGELLLLKTCAAAGYRPRNKK